MEFPREINEGEIPLDMLVSALSKNKGNLEEIPRLAHMEDGKISVNNKGFPIIGLDELKTPVFDGFAEDQWTPEPYVPIGLYRGCWKGNICKFCDLNEIFSGFAARRAKTLEKVPKRMRSLENVTEDIKRLRERGIRHFSFTDEWFLAGHLLKFSDMLLERGIDDIRFDWYGMIEPKYADAENCRKIYKAGGRFVQFGVEARSEEILKGMQKGYKKELTADVLRTTAEAGIMNHIFVMVGYPTSSIEEELLNIPFLIDNKDIYHTEKTTRFRLSSLSRLALDRSEADKAGIRRTYKEGNLHVNCMYEGGNLSHSHMEALRLTLDEVVRTRHIHTKVMGEFAYGQRLFVGLERLKEMEDGVGLPVGDIGASLKKIWSGLVGQDFAGTSRDIHLKGNSNPKKLEAFKRMQNPEVVPEGYGNGNLWKYEARLFVRNRYPAGFDGIDDLVKVSYFIEECYKKDIIQKPLN